MKTKEELLKVWIKSGKYWIRYRLTWESYLELLTKWPIDKVRRED